MSKIEEAIEKARRQRLGKEMGRPVTESPRAMPVPVPDDAARQTPSARSNARREIAQMQEPGVLESRELDDLRIIHLDMEDQGVLESFREIRARLMTASGGRGCSVLVTSPVGNAGSSFVAFNLACAFSMDEARTALFVECDLVGAPFQLPGGVGERPGLTDYLDAPEGGVGDIIHPVGIPRLRVVPAGTRVSMAREHLTSGAMRELLKEMGNRYPERVVVLGGPPIGEASDTHVLVQAVDYVVLTVRYGQITEAQLQQAVHDIPEEKFAGVVFNDEPALPAWGRVRHRRAA